MSVKKATLALTALLALAACKDDDDKKTNTVSEPEMAVPEVDDGTLKITAWDDQYVVDLENIEVVLPNNRLFSLDTTAFCPSLSGKTTTLDEYTAACREITQSQAQYIVDVYACRGKGDTFYAAMPASTREAAAPFNTTMENYNDNRLFSVEGMRRQFENFGNDNFTVSRAEQTGTREYSHADAMTEYIAEGRGNHKAQDPMCSAQFKYNLD